MSNNKDTEREAEFALSKLLRGIESEVSWFKREAERHAFAATETGLSVERIAQLVGTRTRPLHLSEIRRMGNANPTSRCRTGDRKGRVMADESNDTPMTRDELLSKLAECAQDNDTECAHYDADGAILDYLNDPEISEAYSKIDKWYA